MIIFIIILMTALASQITYYLNIAIDINKKIGGKRGYEAEADNKDKFLIQKENINKEMHYIKAKLQERELKTSAEVLGINMEIKDKIQTIYNQIQRMRESVNNDKSTNEAARNIKIKIIDELKEKTKRLEDIVEGSADVKALTGAGSFGKNQTLTEARQLLLDHEGKNKNSYRVNSKKKKGGNGPTEVELEAMKRWKQNDEKIDERLDDLTQRTIEWKKKVKETGDLIDESDKKIDDLTSEVDKVNDNLLRSNKQLKGIIEQYRKPHKFCIDIILVLVLIGIIVGIVKVTKG